MGERGKIKKYLPNEIILGRIGNQKGGMNKEIRFMLLDVELLSSNGKI